MTVRLTPFVLLAVFLAGCPHAPTAVKFGPDGELKDPQALIALLAKRDAKFVTLKGDVKLKVTTPQQSGAVNQYLAVVRPAALHIETYNFFGKPISVLESGGKDFTLFDGEHGAFFRGPATAEAMGRFLPLVLPPEEIVALLLGQVPRLPDAEATMTLDEKKGEYVLVLKKGPVTQTLRVGTEDLRINKSNVTGVDAYNLRFDDYVMEGGVPFPHKLELWAPSAGLELVYNYKDVEVNGSPDLSLFIQEPPPNASITELDAAGHPVMQKQP